MTITTRPAAAPCGLNQPGIRREESDTPQFTADLVRWFQLDCLPAPFANAEPKTLRWQLWHAPARIVRRARHQIVRILDDWPTGDALLRAYQRIALIT